MSVARSAIRAIARAVIRAVRAAAGWTRAHWFRLAIAAFTLAATMVEWSVIPPVYPMNLVFSGLSVAGILLSPFLPRASGWLIIATVVGRLFVLDLSGPNPLWAAYLALAVIGYDSPIPVAVAALFTVTLAECVPAALNMFNALSATWIGMVNYIGMFTLATMAGMSFRWRRQRDETRERAMALERRQWQLDALRRNTLLASRIHDSASGGLSAIALTAQRQLRRIPDDAAHHGERGDWAFVNERALGVLDAVHQVIDLLETSGGASAADMDAHDDGVPDGARVPGHGPLTQPDDDGPRAGAGRRLESAVDAMRATLASLGMRGSVALRGFPDDDGDRTIGPDAGTAIEESADLIGELGANIARHGDPASAYSLVVTLSDGGDGMPSAVEIIETNPLRPGDSDEGDDLDEMVDGAAERTTADGGRPRPHGSGLKLHRRIIESMGGELNASAEDGDWIVYARIPCAHAPSSRRKR